MVLKCYRQLLALKWPHPLEATWAASHLQELPYLDSTRRFIFRGNLMEKTYPPRYDGE